MQIAHRGHAREVPGELGVLRHVALHEERGHARVEPGGQIRKRDLEAPLRHLANVVFDGDGVGVDDAVDRIEVALVGQGYPVFQGAEVIADVEPARGLHARENPRSILHGTGTCIPRRPGTG